MSHSRLPFLLALVLLSSTAQARNYARDFDAVVARIEAEHVFPPAFARVLGHDWHADLPRLRREFAQAHTRREALVALRHLENSLHDKHCRLQPPPDLQPEWLSLPVTLWAGGSVSAPELRVAAVTDAKHQPELHAQLQPGDEVVAVDGQPPAAWLAAHAFETNALEPRLILDELARAITTELAPWTTIAPGDTRTLTLVHDGQRRDVKLAFRSAPSDELDLDLNDPPPMAKVDCDPRAAADYPGYALAAVGANLCVYAPPAMAPRVPIVRFLSFDYFSARDPAQAFRLLRADHDLLARELRGAAGVVVDLHANFGGNVPYVFLGWFAARPFDHAHVATRALPGAEGEAILRDVWGDDSGELKAYRAAIAQKQPWVQSRFFCDKRPCDGDVSAPPERVTSAPVVVVTGPGCMSSCDTFAATWSRFALGGLVGKQPAHVFTVNRHTFAVADLGRFTVAISEFALDAGPTIEGEPLRLDWEAPGDFASRESWVRAAVTEAIRRLSK